jgi:hypothetical protein
MSAEEKRDAEALRDLERHAKELRAVGANYAASVADRYARAIRSKPAQQPGRDPGLDRCT